MQQLTCLSCSLTVCSLVILYTIMAREGRDASTEVLKRTSSRVNLVNEIAKQGFDFDSARVLSKADLLGKDNFG